MYIYVYRLHLQVECVVRLFFWPDLEAHRHTREHHDRDGVALDLAQSNNTKQTMG